LALQPHIAACALIRGTQGGWFTGKKLADYTAFKDMRRVVNGTDRASEIALIAESFLRAIEAASAAPSGSAGSGAGNVGRRRDLTPSRGLNWWVIAGILIAAVLAGIAFIPLPI